MDRRADEATKQAAKVAAPWVLALIVLSIAFSFILMLVHHKTFF